VITDNAALAEGLDSDPLVIPRTGPLTALTAVLPLQVNLGAAARVMPFI
jgi:hypothetical protein